MTSFPPAALSGSGWTPTPSKRYPRARPSYFIACHLASTTTRPEHRPAGGFSDLRCLYLPLCRGVDRFIKRAKVAGIKAYFFVDLIVLPTTVLAQWPNATRGGKVQWNDATRQLLQVLVAETFARFPGCDGWIVRTGERQARSPCL